MERRAAQSRSFCEPKDAIGGGPVVAHSADILTTQETT